MIRHKFNAKPTTINSIRFDSTKESKYYSDLLLRQKAGEVVFFLRQTPFHLPGGIKYICDFTVFLSDGSVEFIDIKGVRTSMFITKKKMVEDLYPIEIKEI